jgi:cobalt-zinc-cadmium efflux system membrane fusion protein
MKSIKQCKASLFGALALLAVLALLVGCGRQDSSEAPEDADHDHAAETRAKAENSQGEEEAHGDLDEHGEEGVVRLSEEELKEFGIEIATAGPGSLVIYTELPGEIVLNADRLAHVLPRVPGIVREVRANVGDSVERGLVMAVLESGELADTKAAYLAAKERQTLADANFQREELLWQKKISSEQDYLDARQALSEARIEKRAAEQKLHALGFSETALQKLSSRSDQDFLRHEIKAPFSGTVIEKHITLGESLKDDAEAFVVADLSSVWVDIQVYQKDLPRIRKGQRVVITAGHDIPDATDTISWVGPVVGEATRTAKARVVLANPDGALRPGLFVTARILSDSSTVSLLVPKTALQTVEDRTVVFVRDEDGFEPRPVKTGRENASQVEIVSGLHPGQTYVSQGAFTLKAQLSKGAFGDGHAH